MQNCAIFRVRLCETARHFCVLDIVTFFWTATSWVEVFSDGIGRTVSELVGPRSQRKTELEYKFENNCIRDGKSSFIFFFYLL